MNGTDDLMAQINGLAPDVAAMTQDDHLFKQPEFTFEVKSTLKMPGADKMDGTVVMRFPNWGDELEIARISRILGGAEVHVMHATLVTCIVKAPASWYELSKDSAKTGGKPSINLIRLVDSVAMAQLYQGFLDWQRSFR